MIQGYKVTVSILWYHINEYESQIKRQSYMDLPYTYCSIFFFLSLLLLGWWLGKLHWSSLFHRAPTTSHQHRYVNNYAHKDLGRLIVGMTIGQGGVRLVKSSPAQLFPCRAPLSNCLPPYPALFYPPFSDITSMNYKNSLSY